jgi:cytochrome c2
MIRVVMGAVAIAVALVAFDAAWAQPTFSPSQDPMAGARVFAAKGCEKCHAINGVGGKIGPDLAKSTRPHSFYDVAAAL